MDDFVKHSGCSCGSVKVMTDGRRRELILRILQDELGETAVYHPLPEFAYSVGSFTLHRDGSLTVCAAADQNRNFPVCGAENQNRSLSVCAAADQNRSFPVCGAENQNRNLSVCGTENQNRNLSICSAAEDNCLPQKCRRVLELLAGLGLCDYKYRIDPPDQRDISYTMEGHSGTSLMNLISIMSARQNLINSALDARGAFCIAPELVNDLLAHPPETSLDFLQALYGRTDDHKGLEFTGSHIVFTGFRKCRSEESDIHRQLADLIIKAALGQNRVKPFTRNVRNRKYAFRMWLYSIGMSGPDHEEARRVMLSRLYGRADRRSIPRQASEAGKTGKNN